MTPATGPVELFLHGAETVAAALADPAVAGGWDRPSVLEEQQVSGLCGHLARGAVWAVGDYLDAGLPSGPADFTSAADYFATLMDQVTPADHAGIRQRGAETAAGGHEALVRTLRARIDLLTPRLRGEPADRLIAVIRGKAIRLDDYLTTRIVEQVVHLDDLARSVGRDPWPIRPEATGLVIAVGAEVARRRRGDLAVMRAFYREGFAGAVFPVF